MTATNHALTGAVIGFAIGNPWVALPVAFLSHFLLDIIPHFGNNADNPIGKQWFKNLLLADALVCVAFVVVLAVLRPEHWLLASFAAFAATSPDLMWVKRFLRARKGEQDRPKSQWPWVMRFHAKIQWFERPVGALVEVAWLCAVTTVLVTFIQG